MYFSNRCYTQFPITPEVIQVKLFIGYTHGAVMRSLLQFESYCQYNNCLQTKDNMPPTTLIRRGWIEMFENLKNHKFTIYQIN